MRQYELVMVITPEAGDDQVAATLERVSKFITDRGGSVEGHDQWGLRQLAYPIRRHQEGNYVLTRFTLDTKNVVELDHNLNTSEDVLRHLVVKA
jgi:small subunit ribosomal protein S6